MLVLDLWLARRSLMAERPELRIWAWGSLLALLGFVSMPLRLWMPMGPAILLSNALLGAGIVFYGHAVHQFVHQQKAPLTGWLVYGAGVLLLAWMALRTTPYAFYAAMVSFWFTWLLVPTLQVLLRKGWQLEPSLRTMAITLMVCWTALVVRGVHALQEPDRYRHLLHPDWVQSLTLLTAFLAVIGSSFGFLLANIERTQGQMQRLASCDDLTGCYNRATARTMLGHLLDRCRREGTPMALLLLDLDHFKRVNDEHGHQIGDEVLRRFSAAVRLRLRASDVFGRMGGEEFCVGLPLTDRAGAIELAEALRQTTEALVLPGKGGQPLAVTVSVGVVAVCHTALEQHGTTLELLYGSADDLLYQAKRLGRNRVVIG
ncbi:GGDEF domain-containing protein [Sphaerotilus sp.]|uniref:GGDEF domain-containing protein n=1 Tax=Sphaerotilus sp. TaxID=2093942 RepID=UPI002ACE8E0B|nr:GGDEF domain-containing protein [Sphaerotilus sp.]MDZ7855719.1 GGDEF domain-containing protein [Sphaerotilus sp.]